MNNAVLYILILFLTYSTSIYSQNVEVIDSAGFIPIELTNDLRPLSIKTDIDSIQYVGEIQGRGHDLWSLYWSMHHKATSFGANIYKTEGVESIDSLYVYRINWKIYHCNRKTRIENLNSFGNNKVYVFSPENRSVAYKVNGEKRILEKFSLETLEVKKDIGLKVKKRGLTGHTRFWDYGEGKSNYFISFGMGPFGSYPIYGSNKISFTIGNIYFLSEDFGLFLVDVID